MKIEMPTITGPKFKTEKAQKDFNDSLIQFHQIHFASEKERKEYLEKNGKNLANSTRKSIESNLKWGEELPKNCVLKKEGSVFSCFEQN